MIMVNMTFLQQDILYPSWAKNTLFHVMVVSLAFLNIFAFRISLQSNKLAKITNLAYSPNRLD